jgi:hypothetical protein
VDDEKWPMHHFFYWNIFEVMNKTMLSLMQAS